MLNENAKQWVEALKSGTYKQAQSVLHNEEDDSFCCLGVACDLFNKANPGVLELESLPKPESFYTTNTPQHTHYKNTNNPAYVVVGTTVLPAVVRDWLGLNADTGSFGTLGEFGVRPNSLTALNDRGASFEDIAAIIESEPEGLFA